MCIGIVLGAMIAGSLAGKISPKRSIPLPTLVSAIIGGLIMGYGGKARVWLQHRRLLQRRRLRQPKWLGLDPVCNSWELGRD